MLPDPLPLLKAVCLFPMTESKTTPDSFWEAVRELVYDDLSVSFPTMIVQGTDWHLVGAILTTLHSLKKEASLKLVCTFVGIKDTETTFETLVKHYATGVTAIDDRILDIDRMTTGQIRKLMSPKVVAIVEGIREQFEQFVFASPPT